MQTNNNNGGYPDGYLPIYIPHEETPPPGTVSLAEAKAYVEARYGDHVDPRTLYTIVGLDDVPNTGTGGNGAFEYGNNVPSYESQPNNYNQYGQPVQPIPPQPQVQQPVYPQPMQQMAPPQPQGYGFDYQMPQGYQQQIYPYGQSSYQYQPPIYTQPQYQNQPVSQYDLSNPIMGEGVNLDLKQPSSFVPMYPQPQPVYPQPMQQMAQPQGYGGYPYAEPAMQYQSGQNQYDPQKYGMSATPYADPMYGKTNCSYYGNGNSYRYGNTGYGYGGYPNNASTYQYNQFMNAWEYDLSRQMYTDINDIQYNEWANDAYKVDPFACISEILTEEDWKHKGYRDPRTGIVYPTQETLQEQQKEREKAYESVIQFQIQMYQASQSVCSEERQLSEEQLRIHYDMNARSKYMAENYGKPTEYEQLTPEKMQYLNDMKEVDMIAGLHNRFMNVDRVQAIMAQKQIAALQRIKESHNKLLGVKPGEEVTIEQYEKNFPFLYVDALMRDQRLAMKDKKNKYETGDYKGGLNAKFPSYNLSTDQDLSINNDDYVPLDEKLKRKFERSNPNFQIEPDGSFTFTGKPPVVPNDILRERDIFLNMAASNTHKEVFV